MMTTVGGAPKATMMAQNHVLDSPVGGKQTFKFNF